MRTGHLEQIERWAYFVKNNPDKWKKAHSEFINAIFENHYEFNKKLLKSPNGKEKLQQLRRMRLKN